MTRLEYLIRAMTVTGLVLLVVSFDVGIAWLCIAFWTSGAVVAIIPILGVALAIHAIALTVLE